MGQIITLEDLNTTINHEPRISHRKIAESLGYNQPHKATHLIERNLSEFESYGGVSSAMEETGLVSSKVDGTQNKGGRPAKTYYLNEAQAILLCMFSRTEKAAAVRKGVIEVFMAWRRGQLPAVKPVQQKLPIQHKPVDAKTIHDACDEVLTILGHFKLMTQHSQASKATLKVHNILLDEAKRATSEIVRQVVFHC